MNFPTNHSGHVNDALPTRYHIPAEQHPQQRLGYLPKATVRFATGMPVEPALLLQRRVCPTSVPAYANSRVTAAHIGQIDNIVRELSKREPYLLASQLGLQQWFRTELLYYTAKDYGREHLLQRGLRQIHPNNLFTHQQLLVALARIGRLDLAETYCRQFHIRFDYQPYNNTLQCEEPGRNDYGIDQVLSHFDLCQIFTGQLVDLSSIPLETLVQTTGYLELLNDPRLPEHRNDEGALVIYRFLENIVANKGRSLTVREAVSVLCKPEIGQINIAHRLIKAFTSRQPNMDTIARQKEQDRQTTSQTLQLILGLANQNVPLDVPTFAHTLGIPTFKMAQIPQAGADTQTLMGIIGQSRKLRDHLSAGHILYALLKAAEPYDVGRLHREIQRLKVPLFHQTTACRPPPITTPLAVTEVLTQVPDSKPLTMSFLSDLPLSHNWVLIGLAMGLSVVELEEIGESAKPDARLTAFYLSRKLTEPHRQLETGDLYQVLLELNDQEALRHFPKRLSFKRGTVLPIPIEQAMTSGLDTVKALCRSENIRYLSYINPLLHHEWVNNRR